MPTLEPITPPPMLHAFTGFGLELEYMIVGRDDLAARPIADRLLEQVAGEIVNEFDNGPVAWSNELVLHVIELKTNGPAPGLEGLDGAFHADVLEINRLLSASDAALLPTAMHPLFDPDTETRLWPHGQNEIYAAYDRIFGCAGHGWSNLQSTHINLPFFDDQEFVRLHAAIRVALPLIPALAAASPLQSGRAGWLDTRLQYYRRNQQVVPEISGLVVPEPVASIDEYHEHILAPMYRAIAPHDPDGILDGDWLNSRGAIARFDRQTIEIRVIDIQECPRADLAVAEAVVGLVRNLYEERLMPLDQQQALDTAALSRLLDATAIHGDEAVIDDPSLLAAFGPPAPVSAGQLWRQLLDGGQIEPAGYTRTLDALLRRGPLARAILTRIGPAATSGAIADCYRELAQCLAENTLFQP